MCGICGIVNHDSVDSSEDIKKMMGLLKHRGPNASATFAHEKVMLGFLRLSIIDLSSAANQPMSSASQRYTIVFNGEIFNYLELKEELKTQYHFETQSDTEVVIAAYQVWGEACLHRFNGMFAFAIYDRDNQSVFAARDRFGVKPFYYVNNEKHFAFASEIPPLLTISHSVARVNNAVMYDYLAHSRTDLNEQTFFESVLQLQAGYCIHYKENQILDCKAWYDLDTTTSKGIGAKEFADLFTDSVRLRLRSDVPVGVCLSGGLDSSAISAVAAINLNHPLNAFSAVYGKGKVGDETEYIEELKDLVAEQFYVVPDAQGLLQDLDDFVKTHAEPCPSSSPYAQYKVMQLASKSVVVTLDGQGADEQMAGYHYFFGSYYKQLFLSFKWIKLISEIASYSIRHRSILPLKAFVFFILPDGIKKGVKQNQHIALNPTFEQEHRKNSQVFSAIYASADLRTANRDHLKHKLQHLLKWADRNSMRFSVEAREPFLDYRLVEALLNTEDDMKIRNGVTKYIMREGLKGVLPEKIRTRNSKIGFETPAANWFREEKFREFIFSILNSESFATRPYFNQKQALQLFQQHLDRKIEISKEIWKWINVELWCRQFIDQKF